jgi:ketosteroid isomerase-like protein
VESERASIVCDFVAAFNDGDLNAFVETLDPEIEILSMRGPQKGLERARAWATRKPGGVQQQLLIEELRESGDKVLALTVKEWRWAETGELASEQQMAHLFTLKDGKIARWQPFEDRGEALRAGGLAG